jgi:endo-1,4-beta-xylanase
MVACAGKKPSAETVGEGSLKQAIGDRFLIGTALNTRQSSGRDTAAVRVVKQHFNAIVAENCMKSESLHPEEGRYTFDDADALVRFGEENGMTVTGHCLIWHSQLPKWFAVDQEGKPVTAEVLKARMKEHISTVVGRYKGRIKGWDVVNEAIVEDGSYRKSPFYDILGEEFIPLAFQYAHEADPDAELYYNDYGMDNPGRRDGVVRLVKQLKDRGLRIDAVGMQGHVGMDYPDIKAFETSMMAFVDAGVKVMITELDMSALPTLTRSANVTDRAAFRREMNPYPETLPDSVSQRWNARMREFFDLFVKHSDVVTRVTAWGVSDGDSWKNNFPMPGRHDYPLLFDRQYQPKPFVKEIIEKGL